MRTAQRRFVGQNIKGTPAMPAKYVRHDLRQVRSHSDAYGLQEFKWPWYWRMANLVMAVGNWGMFPNRTRGLANPILGAQSVGWNRDKWRIRKRLVRLLMDRSSLTTKRYLRAALLEDPDTKLRCWHGSTHFVVGGDGAHSMKDPKAALLDNIDRLGAFLQTMIHSGWPIIFELDANIHKNTAAAMRLINMVENLGGTFHGDLGVEYLFTIPGEHEEIVVTANWTIPINQLFTDHEGRGITYFLQLR